MQRKGGRERVQCEDAGSCDAEDVIRKKASVPVKYSRIENVRDMLVDGKPP